MSTGTDDAVKAALAPARIATYEAASPDGAGLPTALALYAWNAQMSAALLNPLHVCEVVIRNAVSDALVLVYGDSWHRSSVFQGSLPTSTRGFNAREEISHIAHRYPYLPKAIPEIKFVFWQKMFTARFDTRIWEMHLRTVFPHLDATKTVVELRDSIYNDLDHLRRLRNRIAHHEPIFKRDLADEFMRMSVLISHRCPITAAWMNANQQVSALLAVKPI